MHMRFAPLILAIMLLALALADASTEASAFSRSYLILNDSSTGALETISQNTLFYPPGQYIKSYGEAELAARSRGTDPMILDQSINFNTTSSQHMGTVSTHIRARNLTELDLTMRGIASSGLIKEENLSLVKSESSGLGLACSGEGKYAFYLTGGHNLKLDFGDLPQVYTKTLEPYEFSFQADQLLLDEPADFFDQRVDLIYSVSADYQSSFAGYRLSRSLEDDGIRCRSEMEYGVVSD